MKGPLLYAYYTAKTCGTACKAPFQKSVRWSSDLVVSVSAHVEAPRGGSVGPIARLVNTGQLHRGSDVRHWAGYQRGSCERSSLAPQFDFLNVYLSTTILYRNLVSGAPPASLRKRK